MIKGIFVLDFLFEMEPVNVRFLSQCSKLFIFWKESSQNKVVFLTLMACIKIL